jgi:adenosylcobinamide kinase/adenosylcobinamide-phosphate guanylyltransferase
VLITHAHPDHLSPALLLWRSGTSAPRVLTVVGPELALASCVPWIGPDDPVQLHPVTPGDVVEIASAAGPYVVRVHAADHTSPAHPDEPVSSEAVLYDVTAPDGSRLLHATDTGPLPRATLAAVEGAAFDAVLLEETFGDLTGHGTGHHDLTTFPATLRELRARGAVVDATRVVAVHLSHHNPPAPELARRLAPWGAEVQPDLAVLDLAVLDLPGTGIAPPVPDAAGPRRTLLLGGARSGKSREAERRLAAHPSVTYVATGSGTQDDDASWAERVAAHQRRRPASWRTRETRDLVAVLDDAAAGDAVLVDCLTLWTTGLLDDAGAWDDPGTADAVVREATAALVHALRDTRADVVLVSNEVGQGVVPATASGRLFRDLLGSVHTQVGAVCDEVVSSSRGTCSPGPTHPEPAGAHDAVRRR